LNFFLGELEIASAKASDSGLWLCVSTKDPLQILDTLRILVIPQFAARGSFLFDQSGHILSNSSVIKVMDTDPLFLICVSRSSTPQDLHFSLNNHAIRGHTIQTYLVGPALKTSVAYKIMNKTSLQDKSIKHVSCGTTRVKIIVKYPPSFTIQREPLFGIPVIQGMTVSLTCSVDSFPNVKNLSTNWLKNENPTNNSVSF
jgi:hypothetical protein